MSKRQCSTIHNFHPKITLRMCHLIKQLMTFHFGGHWFIKPLEVMLTSAVGFGEHYFLGVDKSQCPPYEKSLIVYCYTPYINYHKYINLIGQWVKIRTRDHTGQKSYSVKQNHIPPPLKPRGFSRQSCHSLTGKRQRHSERINCRRPLQVVVDVVFKCLRQRSNGFKICLPAVFYMYVFSWFHSV
jgi:hypothetical protein